MCTECFMGIFANVVTARAHIEWWITSTKCLGTCIVYYSLNDYLLSQT